MKDFISKKKSILAFIAILLVFTINGKTLFSGLYSDFFGVLVSCFLFVIGGRKTNFKINYFLIVLILLLELISYRLNTKSVHFLAIIFFLYLAFHYFTGKFSFIAFICILLFSTLFTTFFNNLITEIKQFLCYAVYLTLKSTISFDKIEGVNFYINNAKITIDTACMGLSMFKTGLLFGAILMTLEEKKQKHYYGIFQILIFCFLIIILNIISNYFRIITLLIFNCREENTLHHTIGLLCFIIYQIIPILIIVSYLKPKSAENNSVKIQTKAITLFVAFSLILIVSLKMKNETPNNLFLEFNSEYNIKMGTWVNSEVFKIESKNCLTYIKTPSHNPLVCWTGNGYKIIESKKVIINKEEIWSNKMEKDSSIYNSYWWYECGNKKYTSFIEVMFIKLISGKSIRLINKTSKIN
ncbi:MAG: exosortase N [Flavobacterium sp.]